MTHLSLLSMLVLGNSSIDFGQNPTRSSASVELLLYLGIYVFGDNGAYRRVEMNRKSFVLTWFATLVATLVAVAFVPGMSVVGGNWAGPIAFALVLAFLNASIKPVVQLLSLPITLLTLGIFSLVINAFMLELASFLSRHVLGNGVLIEGFGSAFLGAIVISLVSSFVAGFIKSSD